MFCLFTFLTRCSNVFFSHSKVPGAAQTTNQPIDRTHETSMEPTAGIPQQNLTSIAK